VSQEDKEKAEIVMGFRNINLMSVPLDVLKKVWNLLKPFKRQ